MPHLVFGVGASAYAANCEWLPSADPTRLPAPPSRQGHRRRRHRAGRIRGAVQAVFGAPHSNSVPSVQTECRMTAILRAIATLAFLAPMRFTSRAPKALRADQRFV